MSRVISPEMLAKITTLFFITTSCLIMIGCGTSGGDNPSLDQFAPATGYQAPHQPYVSDPSIDGFNLSGTLSTVGHVASDWDVNDPDAPRKSNNLPEDAQPLKPPVTVGGFICGPDAESSIEDMDDYYTVTLSAGDIIQIPALDGADNGSVEVELALAGDPGSILNSTILDEGGQIEIKENNDYLIHVFALSGAFNYTLYLGNQADRNSERIQNVDEFVPGEAIVRFNDSVNNPSDPKKDRLNLRSFMRNNNLLALDQQRSDQLSSNQPVLLKFKDSKQRDLLRHQLDLPNRINRNQAASKPGVGSELDDTLAIISALNQQPNVVYAEPNYYRKLFYVPNDEFYYLQWNYPLIGLEEAWDITRGSSDVIVAVIDSGVHFDHPDLAGIFTDDGYDFISSTNISLDGDGIDPDPTDPGDDPYGYGSFHGTHVAGIIAATMDNDIGVAGIGGQTRIMPIRSIGLNGSGTVMDTLQAMRYAAGMPNDSGRLPRQPADIINLSLGGDSSSQAEADLLEEITTKRNIVVVAAAGNIPTDQPTYPASYPNVMSVSAVDFDRHIAPYSSYGESIDVAAPGGVAFGNLENYQDGILSTIGVNHNGNVTSDYAFYAGTSMAASHISGVIALMKAVKPDLTPADVFGWLIQGALSTDLGETGWDPYFGYGLINAHQAVLTAQNEPSPDLRFTIYPNQLDFDFRENEAEIRLSKMSAEALTFSQITATADWVHVSPSDVDDDMMGTYLVKLDRTYPDLNEPGLHEAQVAFIFGEQTMTLTVKAAVSAEETPPSDGDNYIGHLHVLLLDADSHATLYGLPADFEGNGQYHFEFDNLPPGKYLVVAGSNRDGDSRVGERGEALSIESRRVDLYRSVELNKTIKIGFNLPETDE
jgi:serine protease